MMQKNSYIGVDSSYEEKLVLETLRELPTRRNKDKLQDELFAKVLGKLPIEDRVKVFMLCVKRGSVG